MRSTRWIIYCAPLAFDPFQCLTAVDVIVFTRPSRATGLFAEFADGALERNPGYLMVCGALLKRGSRDCIRFALIFSGWRSQIHLYLPGFVGSRQAPFFGVNHAALTSSADIAMRAITMKAV